MSYTVTWEDQGFEDEKTPLDAARQAAENIATGQTVCFMVTDHKAKKTYSVNLDGDDVKEVKDG